MARPILATKLYRPPLQPNVVRRPRLLERLNEGRHRKLTLVSAPAGFGKTTVVREWISALISSPLPLGEGAEVRVAWLSLDEGDHDLARFLAYLVAALQTLAPDIDAGVLGMLQTPQPPQIETLLTILLNDLAAFPEDCLLVLDDYHTLDAAPIDQALSFLIDHLPPQMHLVIATREDPHLPLARLRARGQLTELRAADLRFTPAEAAEFLNQTMGLNLAPDHIAALEARTEGWIAGLQLAALSMQSQPDAAGFIAAFTGSHRFVLDYLLEEVLHQQPAHVQTFLLGTSILNRLCGPLCEAVLLAPAGSGQATLEQLERANLFIVPLDNERRWYRYHQLFADLLRQRLFQNSAVSLCEQRLNVPELHNRASFWYEDNHLTSEAFHHAIAAGNLDRAAGLAELAWQAMDRSFQCATWIGWLKKLPETVMRCRPVLCVQYAWALIDAGELEASEAWLQDAERWLKTATDDSGAPPNSLAGAMVVVDDAHFRALPASIALARAYKAQIRGNLAATTRYAEFALTVIPEDDLVRRAQATIILEFSHWARGELEAAYKAMCEWTESMLKAGNIMFAVATGFGLADVLVAQGRLREAVRTYQQSLELAAEHDEQIQRITAHHHLGLALVYHEMNEQEAAARHLNTSEALGKLTTLIDWPYRWHVALARFKESAGELEAALELLAEAQRRYVRNPVPDFRPIAALKARVWLKQGRLTDALAWARERGLAVDDELSYLREFEHLTFARILIAEYQCDHVDRSIRDALKLLTRLLQAAEGGRRMGSVLAILIVQALAYQAQRNMPLARASLERALKLAEPEGYVRIFADEGEPMRLMIDDWRLLISKQDSGQDRQLRDYAARLLTLFDRSTATPQSTISNQQSPMSEPLSERELDVLRLIAQGLSNQAIGERLFLALSTVKGHNQKIFEKLEVKRRTEAVARARDLGLL